MLISILKKSEAEDSNDTTGITGIDVYIENRRDSDLGSKPTIVKNKIQFMGKLAKMQRLLREERESILKIKFFNDNKLPQGILLDGKEAIERFLAFKTYDALNEMMPKP